MVLLNSPSTLKGVAAVLFTLLAAPQPANASAVPVIPAITVAPDVILEARQAQPTTASVSDYSAVGCFQDGSNHILTITSMRDSGMTPELCRNWCSVESASIFGVKFGGSCLCGNEIEPFAVMAPNEECTRACFGANSVVCGAQDRMNVYAHTDVEVPYTNSVDAPSPTRESDSSATSSADSDLDNDSNGSVDDGDDDDDNMSLPPPDDDDSEDGSRTAPGGAHLSIGVVVGIAIGAAAIAGTITAVVMFFFCRRRRNQYRPDTPEHHRPPPGPMSYAGMGPPPPAPGPQPYYAPKAELAHTSAQPYPSPSSPSKSAVSPVSPFSAQGQTQDVLGHQVAYEMPGGR